MKNPHVQTKKPSGYVIQHGVSPIDGKAFVVIATTKTTNRKTGPMIQFWILREDINPVEAIKQGEDKTICGNCFHRGSENRKRTCYVNAGQAPLSVYKAYKRGIYPFLSKEDYSRVLGGHSVRFGAYGDPAIMSIDVVKDIISVCQNHTGYTHQWKENHAQVFKNIFMASCDSAEDYINARLAGWKTFNVVPVGYKPSAIKQCPATVRQSLATCSTCKLCNGAKADIYVEAHGINKLAVNY